MTDVMTKQANKLSAQNSEEFCHPVFEASSLWHNQALSGVSELNKIKNHDHK